METKGKIELKAPEIKPIDLAYMSANFDSIDISSIKVLEELKIKTAFTIEKDDGVQNVNIKTFKVEYIQPRSKKEVLVFFNNLSYTFEEDGKTIESDKMKNIKMTIR